jgi:DNA repair exonuclease SbcCD ATPase subunit
VTLTTRAAVLAAVLVLPAAAEAAAQRPVSARAPSAASAAMASRDEIRAWMGELRQIGARLQAAHDRAMRQDARLRAAQDSLAQALHDAIDRVDPGLPRLAERAQALQADAQRASQAGDQGRIVALMDEADRIQRRFRAARDRAIANPALARRIRAYEARLRTGLAGQEPQLEALLARSTELQQRLNRVAQLQQQMLRSPAPQGRPD